MMQKRVWRPVRLTLPLFVLVLTLLIIPLLTLSGCSTVRFNEKARLAKSAMRFDPDLGSVVREEILSSREGAIGGFSGSGAGGCGCN